MLLQGLENLGGKKPFGMFIVLDEGEVALVDGKVLKYSNLSTKECISEDLAFPGCGATGNFNFNIGHVTKIA